MLCKYKISYRLLCSTMLNSCRRRSSHYSAVYKDSLTDPEFFWGNQAKDILWTKTYDKVLEKENAPIYSWFKGGQLNTCFNCLDRHVLAGRGGNLALIYDSPVTESFFSISYDELLEKVCSLADALSKEGIQKGDRLIIFMPMIIQGIIAMLACARLGAIHSVVFGGFAAEEISLRINDTRPKMIITASCGIERSKVIPYLPMVHKAIELSKPIHVVEKCIVFQRKEFKAPLLSGRDIDWEKSVSSSKQFIECTTVEATDPLYILYTSGTTGAPKGILRDNGGHAVALQWTMKNVFDTKPGDVFWAASDIGWVVGHSFSVYGPLLNGCTSVIYEGKPVGTPNASSFWRVASRCKVNVLCAAPTAIRAIKQEDKDGLLPKNFNLENLRSLFLVGEHADPETVKWAERALGVPIRDHWWQTETGWPICSNMIGLEGYLPVKYGSTYHPCPGYDIRILDPFQQYQEVPRGQRGVIAIKLPLPPGCMTTLYNNDQRYINTYLKEIPGGYYCTGDEGMMDDDGDLFVLSRMDDVINIAGHRLSSGRLEEVISEHPEVAEVAVIGVRDQLKGHIPVALVVLNQVSNVPLERITEELIDLVRNKIGAVACFKKTHFVQKLPKTRSGKILRSTIRRIANGEEYSIPATIEDSDTLVEINRVLHS